MDVVQYCEFFIGRSHCRDIVNLSKLLLDSSKHIEIKLLIMMGTAFSGKRPLWGVKKWLDKSSVFNNSE